jgi:resolvase-like protein
VSIVMVALDGRFLDRAVHALDLAVGPGMLDLSQPMFDAILLAAHIEHMCRASCRRTVRVARRESELDPIVGENRVDLVGDSRDQSFEEGRGGAPSRLPDQLHEGELAGAIDGDVEVELAFSGLQLSDVDVEIADRISLELLLRRLAAIDLRQSADAVALEAAGADFVSLCETWCDTTTPAGRLMITVMGGVAQFERELILARTEEGIAKARKQGKKFGRPSALDAGQRRKIAERYAAGETMAELSAEYEVGEATIWRALQPAP